MNKFFNGFVLMCFWQMVLTACGNSAPSDQQKETERVHESNSQAVEKESRYAEMLKKFKAVSFDTLKVYYRYDDKKFMGKELTLKETKIFPLGIEENYFGKLSGVYACYRFEIDSTRLGLIARTPSEYESSSVKLFIFDKKADKVLDNYLELGQMFGDAGDFFSKASWLFKTKNNEIHSLVYDYESYDHQVDDTADLRIDEWHSYALINCMNEKFDTLSTNGAQLKKRFRRVLKEEEQKND